MNIAARLLKLRGDMGLSQAELAKRAGVSVKAIQDWEEGRNDPQPDELTQLAKGLGLGREVLMLAEETNHPKTKK